MGKTYRNPKSDSPKQKNKGNQSKNKSTKKNNNKTKNTNETHNTNQKENNTQINKAHIKQRNIEITHKQESNTSQTISTQKHRTIPKNKT